MTDDITTQDANTLKQAMSEKHLNGPQRHEAWQHLRNSGLTAALDFVDSCQSPPQLKDPVPYQTWGADQIESASVQQMQNAARLPVAVKGALMPDAHPGYGLPVGGVLATENAVIPYAVGVDIACRMRLTVFDVAPDLLEAEQDMLTDALVQQTRFGVGARFEKGNYSEHAVMDDPAWDATKLLRGLKDKARQQLGSSGGGNHFVEWGIFSLDTADSIPGIDRAGTYLALLSHSGSRGAGYKIAHHYSKLAQELRPLLPKDVRHLAWFEMDSENGQEYWMSMQLAGRYASANHACIHERITRAADLPVLATVENHHNYAWKEEVDGRDVIVHRKGATPAGEGVFGIVPGSMGDPGFVVRGKGNPDALHSAAHGAGRKMGRREAKRKIRKGQQLMYLKERGIELIGGGLDEAPQAYKDIHTVMAAQQDLVDVVGEFQPRIVRMADD
jgi:tRNA-splicing ligase RtcB